MHTTKTKLKKLGPDTPKVVAALIATPGNFIACVIIDSVIYQIGEDTPDRMVAYGYCKEYIGNLLQIFDDKGETHIIDKKLKEI